MARALLVALTLAAVLISGCGGDQRTASGLVLTVQGSTPADVSSFTLRTAEGEVLEFEVGRLAIGGDAFPASHLREHQAGAQPIEVRYVMDDGRRVAVRLTDSGH